MSNKSRGVRVIAGTHRGRRLVVPEGKGVRPTKDMAREAMFSALDARGLIVGATVLDLYAGTGALAIEALSRGAERAVLVERDRGALAAMRANIEALGLRASARVAGQDVPRFLGGIVAPEAPFDLVFADPPYDDDDESITELLTRLDRPEWLAPAAVVAVERPVRHPVATPPGWSSGW